MKYAVVSTAGHQYKVSEGDVVTVDLVDVEPQKEYIFPQVLLHVDGDNRMIGKPSLSDIVVRATVVAHTKGPKIRVAKFKAKARYRKVTGYRHSQTKLKIEEIGVR